MAYSDEFRHMLRLGTACALVSTLTVVGLNRAFAQGADIESEEEIEEVIVTGSHIRLDQV